MAENFTVYTSQHAPSNCMLKTAEIHFSGFSWVQVCPFLTGTFLELGPTEMAQTLFPDSTWPNLSSGTRKSLGLLEERQENFPKFYWILAQFSTFFCWKKYCVLTISLCFRRSVRRCWCKAVACVKLWRSKRRLSSNLEGFHRILEFGNSSIIFVDFYHSSRLFLACHRDMKTKYQRGERMDGRGYCTNIFRRRTGEHKVTNRPIFKFWKLIYSGCHNYPTGCNFDFFL